MLTATVTEPFVYVTESKGSVAALSFDMPLPKLDVSNVSAVTPVLEALARKVNAPRMPPPTGPLGGAAPSIVQPLRSVDVVPTVVMIGGLKHATARPVLPRYVGTAPPLTYVTKDASYVKTSSNAPRGASFVPVTAKLKNEP